MELGQILLLVATVLTALHAGLLFDFAVDTVPAMRKLPPKEHIRMFQAIDKVIISPLFVLTFLGPIILLPIVTFLYRDTDQFSALLAATIAQIALCCGVTIAKHLPLNASLAKIDTSKITDSEAEKIRSDFQGKGSTWTIFHTVRTIAGITTVALLAYAALLT